MKKSTWSWKQGSRVSVLNYQGNIYPPRGIQPRLVQGPKEWYLMVDLGNENGSLASLPSRPICCEHHTLTQHWSDMSCVAFASTQFRIKVGPASTTLAQHCSYPGLMPRIYWQVLWMRSTVNCPRLQTPNDLSYIFTNVNNLRLISQIL